MSKPAGEGDSSDVLQFWMGCRRLLKTLSNECGACAEQDHADCSVTGIHPLPSECFTDIGFIAPVVDEDPAAEEMEALNISSLFDQLGNQ